MSEAEGKNILLIIDPQNDFTDHPDEKEGSLAVPGALKDYERIVAMLQKYPKFFHEIHVSLDTHTSKHIGHPNFWKVTSRADEPSAAFEATTAETDAVPNSVYILSINKDNEITGTNIVPVKYSPGTARYIKVEPRETALNNYVAEYLKWFDTPDNTHGQRCFIWKEHCIEDSIGHQVSEPLKTILEKPETSGKVIYHIKGQNNLAEMYSIFKAEKPVSEDDMETYKDYIYTGSKKTVPGEQANKYAEVTTLKNLNTGENENLLKQLLGKKGINQNTVYICGEARTHCVKSSVIDLLEYAKKHDYETTKIILLKDATSPIMNTPNDILRKMTGKNVSDGSMEMCEFRIDEAKTKYDYKDYTYGTLYNARAIDTTDIGEESIIEPGGEESIIEPTSEGGSRKKGKTTKSRTRKQKKSSKNRRSKHKKQSRSRK